jgi:group I intron endonuclease
MKEPVIYKIRNVVNNKFYVGSTTDTRERFRTHRSRLRKGVHHCRHLQSSWNKYGEDCFKFEVQEVIEDAAKLWEAEERWLAEHFGKDYCYNAGRSPDAPMRGRTGETSPNYGRVWSGDMKEQISATLKAFYAEDPNNHPRLGKTHTQETKEKISVKINAAVAEGRGGAFIPSKETRQKMSEALKGNQNALGYKRSDAEREAIRQRTLGNQNFLGKTHTEAAKAKLRRPIFALLPDGTRRDFAGTALAGEELGVAYPMLVRAMKAQKLIAKGKFAGWLFCYADAPVEPPASIEIPEEFKHLPRTRQQAKNEGAKQYFTGLPCTHGHISPRLTKGTCIACRKAGLA